LKLKEKGKHQGPDNRIRDPRSRSNESLVSSGADGSLPILGLQRSLGNQRLQRLAWTGQLPTVASSLLRARSGNQAIQRSLQQWGPRANDLFTLVQRDIENETYNSTNGEMIALAKSFFAAFNEAVKHAYEYAITVPSLGPYAKLNGYTELWAQKWSDFLANRQPKLMAATFGYVIESLVSEEGSGFRPSPPSGCSVIPQVAVGSTRPDLVLALRKGGTQIAWLDLTASGSVDHIFDKDNWQSKIPIFAEVSYPSLDPGVLAFMKQNKDNTGSLSREEFEKRRQKAIEDYNVRKDYWLKIGEQFQYSRLSKEVGVSREVQQLSPEIPRRYIRQKLQEYFKVDMPIEEKLVPSILVALGVSPVSWGYVTGYASSERAGEAWLVDNDPSLPSSS